MSLHAIIELGWRELDAKLERAIPIHAARVEIAELIAALRTAEKAYYVEKLLECDERIKIALAGTAPMEVDEFDAGVREEETQG